MKPFSRAFYHSSAWKRLRESVVRRDRGMCQRCLRNNRVTPGDMVHHIDPLTPENIDDASVSLNPDNLELVCKQCHEEIHRHLGYGALNERRPEEARVGFDKDGNVVRI